MAAEKLHSVEYGNPNNKTSVEIENYMKDPVNALDPLDNQNLDKTQTPNDELLQIISNGIDSIVIQLKNRLGNNFEESNKNAKEIIRVLNQLDVNIKTDLSSLPNNLSIQDDQRITFTDGNFKKLRDINLPTYSKGEDINDISVKNEQIFENLDSKNIDVVNNQNSLETQNSGDLNDYNNRLFLKKRLKNCQSIEFLYLNKHAELMKIFEFTLNLFDKYKYSTKVMLFLLKHLVYKDTDKFYDTEDNTDIKKIKDNNVPNPININIPIPIIKNIHKLLLDQKKVQSVIDRMKDVITTPKTDENKPEYKLQKQTKPLRNETQLNKTLGKEQEVEQEVDPNFFNNL